MNDSVDLHSVRAQKARLARRIGKTGFGVLVIFAVPAWIGAAGLLVAHINHIGYLLMALALLISALALWYKRDLAVLAPDGNQLTDRLSGSVLNRLKPGQALTPQVLWDSLSNHWQVNFLTNHLFIPKPVISSTLAADPQDLQPAWQTAAQLANGAMIEPGHIAAALLLTSAHLESVLSQIRLQRSDVAAIGAWLSRALDMMRAKRPYFGGVGRDWANGFTPLLNRFGHNVSLDIERSGTSFSSLIAAPGVLAMKDAFSQGSSAIALIGESGVGKTINVYALAQLLLEEHKTRNLEHRQIVELDPSPILASASHSGQLEQIVIRLMRETAHAGHIILFFDNSQVFFESGVGAFDITHILLPIIQARAVQLVLAMTPHDYQQLKSTHETFANALTPVSLSEPDEANVMRILEDTALGLEQQHHVLISYDGLREAYRLSGRYEQGQAYPGKAIRLLTQSINQAQNGVVDGGTVQATIEQTHGVKVSTAGTAEADTLLHLEDKIHEHMINQTQAVKVVAGALRRARAGIANPKRPFGSFLFLGPTGVGKTELAKAIAITYFGAASNMLRLDMSEYQRPEDVKRLLSDGQAEAQSLIMAVRQQPFSVVLLDEIEKAHPNVLNLLLQLLDEGQLTDTGGRPVSFRDCVIIATSNAGAQTIRERVERGEAPETFRSELLDELMQSGQFKPELLNRFDEIVVFRPLTQDELAQVVLLMMQEINQTLAHQNITIQLTPAAIAKVVTAGYDPRLGARPIRHVLQRSVEDTVAQKILRGEARAGDQVVLDAADLAV